MLFLAEERTTAALASPLLCFQAIWEGFIISRKCLKVFIVKTSSERVSVCVCGCGSIPAEKAAASTLLCSQLLLPAPVSSYLCWLVSVALREGLCCRIRERAELADPRTGRIHSIQVSVRIVRYKRKQHPYSPEVCPLSRDTD